MGILDGMLKEVKRNFVARPDAARQQIIYKHPDDNIRTWTQLTCQPDEMAIFVAEGKVAGKLGPGGTFNLESKNIPFVSMLLEKATGGNLFITNLYFVSLREMTDVRFGGSVGEITDCVTTIMFTPMIHGDFTVKVIDPERLFVNLVGTGTKLQNNNDFLEIVKRRVLSYLTAAIARLGTDTWPINKMISPAYKLELQAEVLKQIAQETGDWGLQVVRFGNFEIKLNDEEKAQLNEENAKIARKRRDLGVDVEIDTQRAALAQNPGYQVVGQIDMMRGAGQGMAKGGESSGNAMAGMGLGMGMQMSQMFGQMQPRPVTMGGPMGVPGAGPEVAYIKCPSCGSPTSPQGKFCVACGKPTAPPTVKCACGADLNPGAKFCANCGKPAPGPKTCACGTELAAGSKFCPNCGKPSV